MSQWEAEQFAREKHRQLQGEVQRVDSGLPGRVRFSELLESFTRSEMVGLAPNTRRSYKTSFIPFGEFFVDQLGDPSLERIRPGHVREFMHWRKNATGRKSQVTLQGGLQEQQRSTDDSTS